MALNFLLFGVYWASLIYRFVSFIKFGNFSFHYLYKYSFCPFHPPPPLTTLYLYWCVWWYPTGTSSSVHFSYFFSSLSFRLVNFSCSVFLFAYFFPCPCSDLLLNPLQGTYHFNCTFSIRISVCFLFMFSFSQVVQVVVFFFFF